MNILLVYPEYPDTFWSFKYAIRYISRKAAFPPLGLLTVASILPKEWNKKLVDINVRPLKDKDLKWADMVFISAMIVQKESSLEVMERCNKMGIKVVCGGPMFTSKPEDFPQADHLVLGEGEVTIPQFVEDIEKGEPKRIYHPGPWPSMEISPLPQWDLIQKRDYASLAVQYSRGCPFNCEFCDIIVMNGRVPRTKCLDQLLAEFDSLHDWGWRGPVFIVDDNFIGNKAKVKKLLQKMIPWQKEHKYPFDLFTEASLNLGADDKLLGLMQDAGFNKVFIGLETPDEGSLLECSKVQNTGLDTVATIRKIQNYGMEVMGGFILGFDSDPPAIFDNQIKYIQNLGVVLAMVGLLNALPGTRLYKRLKAEGRLLSDSTGNNSDIVLNFIPKMDPRQLIQGYKDVLEKIYSTRLYYERIQQSIKELRPVRKSKIRMQDMMAFIRSMWSLGVISNARFHYWKLILTSLVKNPKTLPFAVSNAIMGVHFQKLMKKYISIETDRIAEMVQQQQMQMVTVPEEAPMSRQPMQGSKSS
jgi:radical SAM superfamily enzyme YgiQ (UPF0313 family)